MRYELQRHIRSSLSPGASPNEGEAGSGSANEEGQEYKISAHLKDGTIIEDVDVVWVGTGYRPSADFVKVVRRPEIHAGVDSEAGSQLPLIPLLTPPPSNTANPKDARPEAEGEENRTGKGKADSRKDKETDEDIFYPFDESAPAAYRRIPHLHRLILYAPNPSLAFVGSMMTYLPFLTADVVSRWIGEVWSGAIPFASEPIQGEKKVDAEAEEGKVGSADAQPPKDAERPDKEELTVSKNPSPAYVPNSTYARLESERARLRTITERLASLKGVPHFNDENGPTCFIAYSILSVDEEGYGAGLRAEVVEAGLKANEDGEGARWRREVDDMLIKWDANMVREREEMFGWKKEALVWAREKEGELK